MTLQAFCEFCGRALNPEQSFCGGCGRQVEALPGTPATASAPYAAPAYNPPHIAAAKSKTPLLLAGGALIAVAVGAFLLLSGGGSDSAGGSNGGSTGSSQAAQIKPLQITVPSGGSWKERRTPTQLVLASSDSDLDASKPVTGYRIVIVRAKEGQADFATVLQKALGGRTPDDTAANVDIMEEPGYVKVGQTYGTSIAVWTKNGSAALVQRVTYVPAKDGEGYVITEEAPASQWRTTSDLLGDKRSTLVVADAAVVGPPPPSKEVPGAGWPLQFKDTFGPSHDGFIQNPVSGTGYSGTAAPSGGKYVYDLNVTALGMTNIRQRTGGVVGDQCRDCYVSVEVQNLARTSAIFGIALRSGGGEYITLVVDDTTSYWRLAYAGNGAFEDIIPWQTNGNLKAGQVNKLAVLANGNDFTVWINDVKVGQGQSRKGPLVGNVGFYTQPNTLGKMTLAFDNLELHQAR